MQRRDGLEDGAAGDDQVQHPPAAVGFVGVDAARHAQQAGNVHEVEGEMEADDEEPEVPLAELLREHAAGHLRIPVIEGGKDHEENGADQHVVEVRDDEIGVAELPVEGRDGEHDAGEAGDEELEEETRWRTSSEVVKWMLPPQMVASQLKILMPVGTEMTMVEKHEEGVGAGGHADGEHVVRPDAEADEADADRGGDHGRIAEDGLAREDGNDLVGEGEGGQHQDVNLGMAEDPEEVHPEDGRAAGLRVEEVASRDSGRA